MISGRAAPTTVLASIDLGPGSRLVADLHLDAGDVGSCAAFVSWTRSIAGAPVLAILGDLFDVWVGPAQARMAGAALVLEALAELSENGTRVVVVPGNRDFLLDRSFESRSGATLAPDGFLARIAGCHGASVSAVCVHGDTLCTLDRGYQRLRRVLRSGPVQWIAPRLPLWAGAAIAHRLRRASVRAIAAKPAAEKSVQASAASDVANAHDAALVVCGHAHEFRDETLASGRRWIVLDAFGGERSVLRVASDATLVLERPVLERSLGDGDATTSGARIPRAHPEERRP